MASWRIGEPVLPWFQPTPSKRSPVRAPNRRHVSSWWSPRTLTAKCPVVLIDGQVVDVWAMQTRTSGGSSDTEVKELAASPTGPSSPWPVTTVTPVAKWPRIVRKRALSTPSSVLRGGSSGRPEASSMSARTLPGRRQALSAGRGPVMAVGLGHRAGSRGEDERLDRRPVADAGVDDADAAGADGDVGGRVEMEVGVAGQRGGEVLAHGRLAEEAAVGAGAAGLGQGGDERRVVLDVVGVVLED